jgi:hypothetical protein
MRLFGTVIAAFLLVGALPATGNAEGTGGAGAAAQPSMPVCHCPGVQHRHAARAHRYHRHYVRHWRSPPVPMPPPEVVVAYNPLLPSPYDTAYDRAMVLHFRSLPVSGLYFPEPGFAPTPPVRGIAPYRRRVDGSVQQYDGLTGEYVTLSQYDAARALPPPPPPPPPGPSPAKP